MRTYKRRPSGPCKLCDTWRYSLHRDHIVPKFKGGTDEESNWQYICANCHEDKSREERIGFRVFTQAHIEKIRVAAKLRRHSALTRQRMSASHVGMRGRKHTEESKAKMRASAFVRWHGRAT